VKDKMRENVRQKNGFTLVELLIVVAIIGILYTVAMPAYTEQMERSRRADIQQVMLQHGAVLERIYSRNGGYPDAFNGAVNTDFYSFSYVASDRVPGAAANVDFKNRQFTLTATPKSTSAQKGDRCGALAIKQDGTQSATKGGFAVTNCWE